MLLVRTKVFMELIERITRVELENKQLHKEIQAVRQEIALLKKKDDAKPQIGEDENEDDLSSLVHEIMHGVPDKITGKVKLTDGTE